MPHYGAQERMMVQNPSPCYVLCLHEHSGWIEVGAEWSPFPATQPGPAWSLQPSPASGLYSTSYCQSHHLSVPLCRGCWSLETRACMLSPRLGLA